MTVARGLDQIKKTVTWHGKCMARSMFDAWSEQPKRKPLFEAVGITAMVLLVGTLFFGTLGLAWWLRSLAKADVIPVWVFQVTSVGVLMVVSSTSWTMRPRRI